MGRTTYSGGRNGASFDAPVEGELVQDRLEDDKVIVDKEMESSKPQNKPKESGDYTCTDILFLPDSSPPPGGPSCTFLAQLPDSFVQS